MAKIAAARLVDAPDVPETVDILVQQERLEDALRVLRRIVDTQPPRIARAFEILAREAHRFTMDESRGYAPRLQALRVNGTWWTAKDLVNFWVT